MKLRTLRLIDGAPLRLHLHGLRRETRRHPPAKSRDLSVEGVKLVSPQVFEGRAVEVRLIEMRGSGYRVESHHDTIDDVFCWDGGGE